MRKIPVLILAVFVFTSLALAYDPPEILLRIEGSEATRHCCIGDQNQDGYDDWAVGGNIYYGAAEMSPEPGFTIEGSTRAPFLVGRFLDGYPDLLIAQQFLEERLGGWRLIELGDTSIGRVYYDRQVEVVDGICREGRAGVGEISRPTDFNGDGYHDILLARQMLFLDSVEYNTLQIHFGGADFDTVPDWQISRPVPRTCSGVGWRVSCGYDVNGDDYSDMLVSYIEEDWDSMWYANIYELYLGGEPMDTIPALEWNQYLFDPWGLEEYIFMLPDLNDDGYDDWGQHIHHSTDFIDEDSYYIFFGGEEPDIEPDVILAGYPDLYIDEEGEMIGGDFNGDGCGDVITADYGAYWGRGAFRIYFGSEGWHGGRADVEVRGEAHPSPFYNLGVNLGSVGDYNGDGSDDYVVGSRSGYRYIYSGYYNDEVKQPDQALPETHLLSTRIYPNPFNAQLTLDISLKVSMSVTADVYDVAGRHLARLHSGSLESGTHSFRWASDCTGLYFIILESGNGRRVAKVVNVR